MRALLFCLALLAGLPATASAQGSSAKTERLLKRELDRLEKDTHGLRVQRMEGEGWCRDVAPARIRALGEDLDAFEQTARIYLTAEELAGRVDAVLVGGRALVEQWGRCRTRPEPTPAPVLDEPVPEDLPTEEVPGPAPPPAAPRVPGVSVEPVGSVFAGPRDRQGRPLPWGPAEVRGAAAGAAAGWLELGLESLRVTVVGADTVERAAQGQQVEVAGRLTSCAVASLWEEGSFPRVAPRMDFADGWGEALPRLLVEPARRLLSSARVRVVLAVGERALALSAPRGGRQLFAELDGTPLNPEGAEAMTREQAVRLAAFLATAPPCR